MKILRVLPVLLLVSGCATYRVDYDRSYLDPVSSSVLAPGRALLLIDARDYDYVHRGRPSSFHAGGTTFVIPLGRIANEAADEVLAQAFRGGSKKARGGIPDGDFAAIVQVRVTDFWFAFNQIRNLTMAITPQVDISLEVSVLDPEGSPMFSRVYSSGRVNARTVLDTWSPAETMNRHVHQVVQELIAGALPDITANASRVEQRETPKKASGQPMSQSKREQLQDLKDLYEDGLITHDVYEQRQKEILGTR